MRTLFWTVNFKKKLDFCLSEDNMKLQDAQMNDEFLEKSIS